MSRRFLSIALVSLTLSACGRKDAQPPSIAASGDAAPPAPVVASPEPSVDEAAERLPWPEAIREGRFREALEAMARLSPDERAQPEVRLARARALLRTGDAAGAIEALRDLDDELPLLRDVIARTRARAMLEAGPFDRAAEYFSAQPDVASWVRAARAWDRASDVAKATAAWERVIKARRPSRADEERARHRRMALTREARGAPNAAADARWLSIHALGKEAHAEAAELLEELKPKATLTGDELLTRARVLAGAARTDEALAAVERAEGKVPALALCRARAEVLWRARTRYVEASASYLQCSGMGGAHAVEDRFLSARALLRAHKDDEAIAAWRELVRRHPRSVWADRSEFHIARTYALAGRWKDAATAFDQYVRRWPKGGERPEAQRYRAISHLVSGDHTTARKLLDELARESNDALTSGRWANLAALAALRGGDEQHALARWTEVATSRPLSYPALVARARLKAHGGALPPGIAPSESGADEPLSVELPPPVDVLHRIGFDAEAEEALRERERAIVAKAGGRATDALCASYAMLARAKRGYRFSQQVPAKHLMTAPGATNRIAWDCVYPRPHAGTVRASAEAAQITPELIWAVMRHESAFDPDARSHARAVGLMQLLPETARRTAKAAGIDHDDSLLTSPTQSVTLGARYLRVVLDELHGSVPLAIAGYNAGPEAILRWLRQAKGETLDVFIETIPFLETRGYVVKVLGSLARYGYMERGEDGIPELSLDLPSLDHGNR